MSLAQATMGATVAPVVERHRWALTVAMRHGWRRPDFLALVRTGLVRDGLVRELASLAGRESDPAYRAEIAWLLGYCIERGAAAAIARGGTPGVVHAAPVPGWAAIRKLGAYPQPPAWWPWPASHRCALCREYVPRGSVRCPEHDQPE